jgi:hypothetical protein
MKFKALCIFTVSILLIMTVFAGPKAPLRAQDTEEPNATEDMGLATPEEGLDTLDTPAPDATEDMGLATPEEGLDAQDTPEPNATATQTPADTAAFHSIRVINRSSEFLARFWLTWHVPTTGALVALGSGNILAGNSGVLNIPSGAVGIGVRVELYARVPMFSQDMAAQWVAADNCHFAFADAHQDRIMSISAVSTGASISVAPIVADYGCTLESGG